MGVVRTLLGRLAHSVVGAVGLVFAMLSTAALAVAAIIPAALGLLAFLASPVRALVNRLRGR